MQFETKLCSLALLHSGHTHTHTHNLRAELLQQK